MRNTIHLRRSPRGGGRIIKYYTRTRSLIFEGKWPFSVPLREGAKSIFNIILSRVSASYRVCVCVCIYVQFTCTSNARAQCDTSIFIETGSKNTLRNKNKGKERPQVVPIRWNMCVHYCVRIAYTRTPIYKYIYMYAILLCMWALSRAIFLPRGTRRRRAVSPRTRTVSAKDRNALWI